MDWGEVIEINKRNHASIYPSIIHEKVVCVVAGGIYKADYSKAEIVVTINGHFVPILKSQKLVAYWNNTSLTEVREAALRNYSFVHINVPSEDAVEIASWCEENNIPWAFFGCDDEMRMNGYLPTVQWPMSLMDQYGFSPLTGTSAIYHLLQHPISKLYVTGMDLYASCNDKCLPPQFIAIHEIVPQLRYLKEAKEKDGRLAFDIVLDSLVSRYPEFCSRVHELPLIPNPATRECIWPGIKVEPWSIPKVVRIMQEFKQGSEEFFKEVVNVVNTLDQNGSLDKFAKGLIPTTHNERQNGKETRSLYASTGASVSGN